MHDECQSCSPDDTHQPPEISLKASCLKYYLIALGLFLATASLAQPKEIILPAQAPSQRTVQLEEQWRIGGDDDEDVLLGVVATGVLDDAGNVFLLDSQLAHVLVINPEGELTGTLSREGEGPGELTRPSGIFLSNENQIGVSQGFPGKIVLINLDDTPGGSISLNTDPENGGFAFIAEVAKRGGHLVVNHGSGAFDMNSGKVTTTNMLTTIDSEGAELGRFAEHSQLRDLAKQVFDEEANFSELNNWALGNSQVLTIPNRDQYLINVKNMSGEIEQVISRPFELRERSEKDKEDLTSGFVMRVSGQNLEIEKHILDFDPVLSGLNVARDGRIFVENCFQASTLLPDGVAGRFDIVSPDGKLVEELTLELTGFNPQEDRLAFLDGIHFLWMRNFESASEAMNSGFNQGDEPSDEDYDDVEPLEVIYCRIPR